MVKFLKESLGGVINLFLFLAIWALPLIFLMGETWAKNTLTGPLTTVGWSLLAINFALILLSIIKRFRRFTGESIFYSSFLFGFVAWYLGFIHAYVIWGEWGAVIGILLLGAGVVPVALLATAINGSWALFFTLLLMTILIFVTRKIGALIQNKKKETHISPYLDGTHYDQ